MEQSAELKETCDLPPVVEHTLFHHRQRYSWDCGISCVLMALPSPDRDHFISNFIDICKEEGFNKSTWTIDLCYLLKRYGVSHVFHTVTLGINPGYRQETFYDKIIDKDEERIRKRFEEARKDGIIIHKSSLCTEDLMVHLANFGPIILLTNASLLLCCECRRRKVARDLLSCLPWPFEFRGHYIILCGYNVPDNKFYYHNPNYRNRLCTIPAESLDEARLCFGTDEDAILIFAENV